MAFGIDDLAEKKPSAMMSQQGGMLPIPAAPAAPVGGPPPEAAKLAKQAREENPGDTFWSAGTGPRDTTIGANLNSAYADMNRVAALPNVPWSQKVNYMAGKYGLALTSSFVNGGGMAPAKDFNTPDAQSAFSSQLAQWQDKASGGVELFGINGLEVDPAEAQFLNLAGTVAGGVIGGAPGAAIGSAGAKIATGGSVEDAAKNAALAYLGGQVAGGVSDLSGGGATGAITGGAAAGGTGAALVGGDIGRGMLTGALSGGLNNGGSSTDLGGGLTVDASGNVTGGTPLGDPGVDDIDYGFPSTPAPDAAPLGSGLTPSGGQQGLRIPPMGVSGQPGIAVAPDDPLGDPLSFINTAGSVLNSPADFSLSTASGTPGLRLPQAPNLEDMGGQGITAPTNVKLGSPESFINSPEVLAAVQAGVINENGMLPTGGAALGDPTSPINAGTFAQQGVEPAPGAVAAAAEAEGAAPASQQQQAPGQRQASAPAQQQVAAQQNAAQKPAAPTRTLTNATVDKIVNALVGTGAVPGRNAVTTPGATRAVAATASGSNGADDSQSALPAPAGAPTRQKDQSDEQYAQSVVDYVNSVLSGLVGSGGNNGFDSHEGQGRDNNAGVKLPPGLVDLSAQHLADLSLKPGTPEYYEYIMSQFDDVIGRLLNGTDPNDAKFSSQLRAKTRGEQEALYRVLYARGVLDQLMGSGRYSDPFTGREEDVIAPEGQTFNPSSGAYQRGLARSVDEMRGMSPQELRRYIGGMLSRNPDLFHMQARQDARRAMETYAADSGDEFDPLKRRGMLPFSG